MFFRPFQTWGEALSQTVMAATALSFMALVIWVYLTFARSGFWRASEHLDETPEPEIWPEVVAIIPARNEAETIQPVLLSHLASDYPGAFAVILIDDHSTDGTAALAAEAANTSERKLSLGNAPKLEPGWTGKLWALHTGLNRAANDRPHARYVLFTDADIVHQPDTLRRLVAKAEANDLVLTSLMARLDARGFWGGLLIPAFIYFFQMLYPFPRANDPSNDLAAAAGGCMLVRRDVLVSTGGIKAIKDRLIDDCALAAQMKGVPPGHAIWIGLAKDEVISLRDNSRIGSVWHMVTRTAFAQLNNSWVLLFGTMLGMALVYLAAPLTFLSWPWHGHAIAAISALITWSLMTLTFRPTMRLYEQAQWKAIFLPFAALLYTLMTAASAFRHLRGKGGQWKGRSY